MQQPHIYHKLGTSHFFILKVSEEYFFLLETVIDDEYFAST